MAIYSGFFPLKMVIFHCYVSSPECSHIFFFAGLNGLQMFKQLNVKICSGASFINGDFSGATFHDKRVYIVI